MLPHTSNLFSGIPATLREERFDLLAKSDTVRIERIVSDGHVTPPGDWYDQECDEWVLLVSGSATLRFEAAGAQLVMLPGDHALIPAGCRHRVEWTDPEQKTVWVAVHFGAVETS
jgi:cupin 2 domain-containing protein